MHLQNLIGFCLVIGCLYVHICDGSTCAPDEFQCANGRCIYKWYQCDFLNDCGDESDEKDCEPQSPSNCYTKDLNIPNAEFLFCNENYTMGFRSSITIQCLKGYKLLGPNRVNCLQHDQWSMQPQCVPLCPVPDIANANINSQQTSYNQGDQLLFTCNENYVTIGNQGRSHQQVRCSSDGKWVPEDTGCIAKQALTITSIQVEQNASVTLTCESDDNRENRHYFWLQNSEILNSTADFLVNSAGNLTIKKMNPNTIGHFTCFTSHQNGHIEPAKIAYELKTKPQQCPPSTELEATEFKEGLSALLKCPHSAADTEFVWYKNGQPLQENSRKIVFPDGVLYVRSIHHSDQGQYICSMINRDTGCASNHSFTVQTIRLSECGEVTQGYPHPWMTSLWQKGEIAPFCYGTLIKENWVITSAHCLENYYRRKNPNLLAQFYADEDIIHVPVKKVKIHPQYRSKIYANDVGLVQLRRNLVLTDKIKPICLTHETFGKYSRCGLASTITVAGWGSLKQWNRTYVGIRRIQEEYMAIEKTVYCGRIADSSHVCVKKHPQSHNNSLTSMAGDSGSPFEIDHNHKVHLLGIYSWGKRLTSHGDYDFFTNITSYIEWINDTIQNEENDLK